MVRARPRVERADHAGEVAAVVYPDDTEGGAHNLGAVVPTPTPAPAPVLVLVPAPVSAPPTLARVTVLLSFPAPAPVPVAVPCSYPRDCRKPLLPGGSLRTTTRTEIGA